MAARAAFLAGICTAMNQTGFFMSMDVLGVALSTMLVIGSSLVMAGVLGCFLGEAPSRLWWFAALLGIAGSCLEAAPGSFQLKGLLGDFVPPERRWHSCQLLYMSPMGWYVMCCLVLK